MLCNKEKEEVGKMTPKRSFLFRRSRGSVLADLITDELMEGLLQIGC